MRLSKIAKLVLSYNFLMAEDLACELIPKNNTKKIKTIHDCKPDNPCMDVKEMSALFYQVEIAIVYELDLR